MKSDHHLPPSYTLLVVKHIARLITLVGAVTLAGCTFSIGPLADNNLPAKVSMLEERINHLETGQPSASSEKPSPPRQAGKKVLDIRGLDEDGETQSVLIETARLLSFPNFDNSAFDTLTNTFGDNARLEQALLYSGTGTNWHLYHTQPLPEIITATQMAAYRESEQDRATLLIGPRLSISGATLVPVPPEETLTWQEALVEIQNTIGGVVPAGRIFRRATAYLVISEEVAGERSSTLIVFWGISPNGDEIAPGGFADLLAACDNCTEDCPFWCPLLR